MLSFILNWGWLKIISYVLTTWYYTNPFYPVWLNLYFVGHLTHVDHVTHKAWIDCVTNDSRNRLAPNRLQAINSTNEDLMAILFIKIWVKIGKFSNTKLCYNTTLTIVLITGRLNNKLFEIKIIKSLSHSSRRYCRLFNLGEDLRLFLHVNFILKNGMKQTKNTKFTTPYNAGYDVKSGWISLTRAAYTYQTFPMFAKVLCYLEGCR